MDLPVTVGRSPERSGVTLSIETGVLPLYPGALEIALAGHRTGGDPRNRAYVGDT